MNPHDDPILRKQLEKKGFPSLQSVVDFLKHMKDDTFDYAIIPAKADLSKDEISQLMEAAEKFGRPRPEIFKGEQQQQPGYVPDGQKPPESPTKKLSLIDMILKADPAPSPFHQTPHEGPHPNDPEEVRQDDMWWTPKGRPAIKASQMATSHLFYALRQVYNKCVVQADRLDVAEDHELFNAPARPDNTNKQVLKILFNLIGKREDLTEKQLEKLAFMAHNVRTKL